MLRNHGERRPAASLEPAVHVHASGSTFRLVAASVPFEGSNPTPPPHALLQKRTALLF